jgi:hypothetical protein
MQNLRSHFYDWPTAKRRSPYVFHINERKSHNGWLVSTVSYPISYDSWCIAFWQNVCWEGQKASAIFMRSYIELFPINGNMQNERDCSPPERFLSRGASYPHHWMTENQSNSSKATRISNTTSFGEASARYWHTSSIAVHTIHKHACGFP